MPLSIIIPIVLYSVVIERYSFMSEEGLALMKQETAKWYVMMGIVPIVMANLIGVLYIRLSNLKQEPVEQSESYKKWIDEQDKWDEDQVKRQNQNKIDSESILKKYDSMPDLGHHLIKGDKN